MFAVYACTHAGLLLSDGGVILVVDCIFCFPYSEWVTPAALLHPLLLPKIYPPLFNLYALYNEKDDDRYWKRIRLWNKQSNLALMSYLGVDK